MLVTGTTLRVLRTYFPVVAAVTKEREHSSLFCSIALSIFIIRRKYERVLTNLLLDRANGDEQECSSPSRLERMDARTLHRLCGRIAHRSIENHKRIKNHLQARPTTTLTPGSQAKPTSLQVLILIEGAGLNSTSQHFRMELSTPVGHFRRTDHIER